MARYPFTQVDVFRSAPLTGNPLAVVHGADGLAEDQLPEFARWTGLSETVFLLEPTEPEADYRVRIFTTDRELPFAGHPTLGSAYAWLRAGGRPRRDGRVVQQCGVGLVDVTVEEERLAFAAPPLTRFEPVEESLRERLTGGLGLAPGELLEASWLVNGPEWIGVRLASAAAVLAVRPDPERLDGLDVGLIGPHPAGGDAQVEVRAFLFADGVVEDPVTGSLNAGLAHWLISSGLVPSSYVAAQGTAIGAAGRVHLDRRDDALWVGGQVASVVSGSVEL